MTTTTPNGARSRPSSTRRWGGRMLVALLALGTVTALTLGPRAVIGPARGLFLRGIEHLAGPAVPGIGPVDGLDVEQILNVVLFVPLGVALALLLARRLWVVAIAGALLLSATVEFAQASIPGRVPDAGDVLWNTLGGAIGVLLVVLVRLVSALVRRISRDRSTTRREL